jgi:putative transposase
MALAKQQEPLMPRRPRSHAPAGYFHVINRSVRRATLFKRPRDYQAFLSILADGLERHQAELVAYAVLSNHWHLVLGPMGTKELSTLMQWVTATHATRWHRHRQTTGQGPVYQGRFRSDPIPTVGDLMRVCRYVERNALRAGLVKRAQDWPWCSLSERLLAQPRMPLTDVPLLSTTFWTEHVNAVLTANEAQAARHSVPPGSVPPGSVPLGSVPLGSVPLDSVALDDVAQEPGGLASRPQGGDRRRRIGLGDDQDEAHPHVQRAERLRLIKSTRVPQPFEQRRHTPARTVNREPEPIR